MTLRAILLSAAALLSAGAMPAAAQTSSHGIAAVVNDDIITTHDLRQRVLFMLATTGAERDQETIARLQQQALTNLINEHIQLQESNKFEQSISDAEVNRSVARLIGRNGLDPNVVAQQLAGIGVSLETLRDQVRSEIAWQRIVNGLFGSRIRISDAQIDETMARLSVNADKPQYRVAEIFIEATPDIGGIEGARQGGAAMVQQAMSGAPFPLLAQQFSSAPSAGKGGDVGWIRQGELRPEIDAAIMTLETGQVSEPIEVPGGVYVVALLDKRVSESDTVFTLKQVNIQAADEAEQSLAKGRLIAAKAVVQGCDSVDQDLADQDGMTVADMGEIKASELSPQILETLSSSNVNELSEPFDTPGGPVSLLICDRNVTGAGIPTRTEIEDRLMDQQLAQASKRHLRDLRRTATIMMR